MRKGSKSLAEFKFGSLTWRSYNSIKKKAMEQEFSLSGLVLSLSIAFFIVIGSAQALSLSYQTMTSQVKLEKREEAASHIRLPEKSYFAISNTC
ncbi:hypothetical protein HGA64_00955 [Candidatus Falkowbacteria bacterium]|nr:hypothetical protein [Candidatus Falkowbacteria bacterium]